MKLRFEVQINPFIFLEKRSYKLYKFLTFKKASESKNEIKLKYTEKLKKHQADSYSKHECLNLRKELKRLEILEITSFARPFHKTN